MRVFKEGTNRKHLSILKEMPFAIEIHQGIPGTAHFRNGDECHIGCLGCINPRCMYFSNEEIECDRVEGFPNDKSINACPVEALSWDDSSATPVIRIVSSVDESILSILKASVDEFELEIKDNEVGIVTWVGDGIANIDGIDHAFYGEIVIFDCYVS